MTKQKKSLKKQTLSFEAQLLASSIANRISPTTISALCKVMSNDEVLRVLIVKLSDIFKTIELKEIKEITTDLNSFIK